MRINCIIVEDEPLAMNRTRAYVEKTPLLQLVGSFTQAMDAFSFLKLNDVDLIFLDINLGKISGIQWLETTKIKSQVIITTAYSEYALKGFELNVADYLLKPFSFERFLQAVDKVSIVISAEATNPDFVFIKTENRLERINIDDILFIEGMRDYRKIHTLTKKVMTLMTFTDLEQIMPRKRICRVHKSYMAAIEKISTIERDAIRIGEICIPISDTYRKDFFALLHRK